jgi:hypothetical protein
VSPGVVFQYIMKFNKSIGSPLTIQVDSHKKFIGCVGDGYDFKIKFYAAKLGKEESYDSIVDEPEVIKQCLSTISVRFENKGEKDKFDLIVGQISEFT